MQKRDKVELLLIAATAAGTALLSTFLPRSLPLGEVILAGAVLLLAQSLVRDLWIKFGPKNVSAQCALPAPGDNPSGAKCMCAESTVGVLGIVVGIAALGFSGLRRSVILPSWFWPGLVLGVCVFGFLAKNIVIDWRGRRLRYVTDHTRVKF